MDKKSMTKIKGVSIFVFLFVILFALFLFPEIASEETNYSVENSSDVMYNTTTNETKNDSLEDSSCCTETNFSDNRTDSNSTVNDSVSEENKKETPQKSISKLMDFVLRPISKIKNIFNVQGKLVYENDSPIPHQKVDFYLNQSLKGYNYTNNRGVVSYRMNISGFENKTLNIGSRNIFISFITYI